MEQRMIDFIAGLRAAGVRVSVAESQDAFRAARSVGVLNRRAFHDALLTTLVKEAHDRPIFDQLFPLYFGTDAPPMLNLTESLSPEEKDLLQKALRALLEQMRRQGDRQNRKPGRPGDGTPSDQLNSLWQLLQALLQGQQLGQETLEQAGQQAGLPFADHPGQQNWIQQRMMRQLGMHLLDQLIQQLADMLARMGVGQETIDELVEGMEANREALAEQIGRFVGQSINRQQVQNQPDRQARAADLLHRPFRTLSEHEADLLRQELRRLISQLRSRAALRRKKARVGVLDAKKTIRANLRYGGVPMELQFKTRRLKPKLLLICDVSTSMRPVVDFLLRMIYELQDQVSHARSFAFIDDLESISEDFAEFPPDVAVKTVLTRLRPGYYNTDLGNSLNTLMMRHADAVDRRTTVIFVGDARNNYNDPRLDLMEQIRRRSRRVIWLNPEHPRQWGTGDSDMLAYLPYAHAVHRVSNLAELTAAVDKLLSSR
ncbi:MAG: VWA domain-containing protein [Chloroflexi bacterium]|nr:MAG: VWA domain-containing protein [Chloroflexota bacterium]